MTNHCRIHPNFSPHCPACVAASQELLKALQSEVATLREQAAKPTLEQQHLRSGHKEFVFGCYACLEVGFTEKLSEMSKKIKELTKETS